MPSADFSILPRHNNPLEEPQPLVMLEVELELRRQELPLVPSQAPDINLAMALLAKSKAKLVHLVLINLKIPHLGIISRTCSLTQPSPKPLWEPMELQQVLVQQDLMREVEQLASWDLTWDLSTLTCIPSRQVLEAW